MKYHIYRRACGKIQAVRGPDSETRPFYAMSTPMSCQCNNAAMCRAEYADAVDVTDEDLAKLHITKRDMLRNFEKRETVRRFAEKKFTEAAGNAGNSESADPDPGPATEEALK